MSGSNRSRIEFELREAGQREEARPREIGGHGSRRGAQPSKRRVVFLFPGAGVQYPGMGRELYRNEPVFREAVDHCRALLQDLGAADVLPAFLASSGDKEVAQAIQPPSLRLALRQGIEALRGHGVNVTGETLSYAEAPTIANSSSAPARVVQSGAPIARRPLSDVEFVIRAIWQEMFAITEVGLDSNFFDLGGHSLLAVRINSEIRSLLLLDLPISVQFEYPTLRGMAIALAAAGQAHGVDVAAIAATLREVSEMSDEELLVASG